MKTAFRQQITLFVGMTILLALYFWGHNVGDQPRIMANAFIALIGTAADLLAVSLIALVSGGLGRWACQRARLNLADLHRAEIVALEGGLGLGVLSTGALIFGLIGWFNLVMWAVLLVVGALLLRHIRSWLRDLRAMLASALHPQTGWERFIVVIVSVLLFVALLLALAPPFAWDGMTYHLVGPYRYVQEGRINSHPDNYYLGLSQGMNVLFGLAMALFGRETAAAPVHYFAGILALLATAGITRRYANKTTAYMSVLLLLSSYTLWWLFSVPYVDLGLMLYGALALIAVSQWHTHRTLDWLVVAGICTGLAVGLKYTAAILGVALVVFVFFRQPRRILVNGAILGLTALLVFAPWMVKGTLLYENPVYPYVFGGPNWDELRDKNFSKDGEQMLGTDIAWQWPILPLSVTIFGIDNVAPYTFQVGAWLLTAPLILLLGWRYLPDPARRLARDCVLLGLPMLAIWMLLAGFTGLGSRPRYMLIGAPAAAILGALGFYSLSRWPKRPLNMDFVMRAALTFTLLLGFIDIAHKLTEADLGSYFVENNRDAYLRANLGNYYATLRHLETLPAGSTVMFMWEPKSFYCPEHIQCVSDILFDHWARPQQLGTDPDTLMQTWQREGVDYLLVIGLEEGSGFGYDLWLNTQAFSYNENVLFPAKLAEYTDIVWTDEYAYTLHTWKDSPAVNTGS